MATDLEGFVSAEGREQLIGEVRRRIDAEGIQYIYYQFISVTGRIMGKGAPSAHWESMADKGLQLVGARLIRITPDLAARHYEPHRGKPFYEGLIKFMTSSPVLVMALRGVGAIEICRKLVGATFGSRAEPGAIRGDFGVSNSFNLIHGSDAAETAAFELPLWFGKGELVDWTPDGARWVYDPEG